MSIKYSIVIPVYNAESYISKMIDSVVGQDYSNWELIIIDDGSTDASGEICDSYDDKRIHVFHYKNQGQMVARITGISKATGDYTLVVDADDLLAENCLSRVSEVLAAEEVDAVIFQFLCHEESSHKEYFASAPKHTGLLKPEEVFDWVISTYNHGLFNKVFKTRCIQEGAAEATTKKLFINGDYALIIPVLCHIESAYYIRDVLYYYRVYDSSISHKSKVQHLFDTCYVTDAVLKILDKHGIINEHYKKIIYVAFLDMISWMIEPLFFNHIISKQDIIKLRQNAVFLRALDYVKRSNLSLYKKLIIQGIRNQHSYDYTLIVLLINARKRFSRVKSKIKDKIR